MKLNVEGAKSKEEAKEEDEDMQDQEKDVAKKDLKVGKKKGRIHEVRYMDDTIGHELSQDESGVEEDGDVEEEGDENDEMTIETVLDKKKRNGSKTDKEVVSELNSEKKIEEGGEEQGQNPSHLPPSCDSELFPSSLCREKENADERRELDAFKPEAMREANEDASCRQEPKRRKAEPGNKYATRGKTSLGSDADRSVERRVD
ncbi:proline-, glutamic acid- and leucine-rich protein 1-like [Neltuma alba]|uniref:proline-, glutamic acid- and leucine-rich protein 1-like n=1 Tax=Neltuma alba TaxID=207710 RepID=UPI0010A55492|nr:proline-, glutamic acid- and leucine-rich protein 1-like [Prosopis alba]